MPAAGGSLAPGALSVGGPARGGFCTARARLPGGGGSAIFGAEGGERAGCSPGERRGGRGRAGGRALTSTHRAQGEPEQQERLHAEPQIHAAPLAAAAAARPWPGGGGGGGGGEAGGRGRRESRLVRAGAKLVWLPGRETVRPEPRRGLAGRRLLSPAASSLPPRGSAAQLASAAPGAAASSFQVAGGSAAAPTARGSGCQRECAPLTPGAAFCSLWLGREPTWSCGHREGWRGGREEGEGASLPHRPPPGTHWAAAARAREGTSRWSHNKGCEATLTAHKRSPDNACLAGGQRVLET